ncbi:hypothetical protein JCM9279_003014, partial [Rhodotorula babjevae]
GLADIEHAQAKATTALMDTIQVPFHEGHAFSPDGWQAVLYDVRDNTKLLSERHNNFASTIEHTVIRDLEGVRSEIKQHITAVEKEASLLADDVEKEREKSKRDLLELQNGIDTFENSSTQMLPQKDPYLSHHIVENQLKKQVHKENDLQAALIRFQQQQPQFEENVSKSIQSAAKLYNEAQLTHAKEVAELQETIATALQRVEPTHEWEFFKSRDDTTLIDPNTPLRSVDAISFPGQAHASTNVLKEGFIERKKRFSKKYTESYYVLTPSGYLHERKSSNAQDTTAPSFSLFLPECSLSAPSKEKDRSHKIHVEGNRAHRSSFESRMKNSLRFGGKEIAYTFRFRTRAELLSWFETLDQLSRDTKVDRASSNKKLVTDPVGTAVASVGYAPPTEETERTAAAVAAVPGARLVDADEAERIEREQAEANEREQHGETHSAAFAQGGLGEQDHTSVHRSVREDDEDSEEGGGSSEEEYATDDEMAHTRSAAQTPALGTAFTSTEAGSSSVAAGADAGPAEETSGFFKAETLPAYVGSGTSVPEKQALTTEAKGTPPVLGNPISSSSSTPGTNSGETDSAAFGAEAAPATSAATTSAS